MPAVVPRPPWGEDMAQKLNQTWFHQDPVHMCAEPKAGQAQAPGGGGEPILGPAISSPGPVLCCLPPLQVGQDDNGQEG